MIHLCRHPFLLAAIAIRLPHWYFVEEPVRIIKNYIAYLTAFNEIISIPFLIMTLFSPWKNITDKYPKNLMAFGQIMQTLTLNITARVIGFIFRIVTIAFGLVAQIILLQFYIVYFLTWITFPLLFIQGVIFILASFYG